MLKLGGMTEPKRVGNMKFNAICLALWAVLFTAGAQAQSITKCQDAEGKWHYGDFASEACAKDSTITELNERGIKVRESDAPPTQAELDARKAAEEKAKEEAAHRAEVEAENQRLLRAYDSAQSIIDARDERIEAMERDLESQRLFRQDLVDEKKKLEAEGGQSGHISVLEQQIQQYDKAIDTLQSERQATIEDYNQELKRYRELANETGE